MSRAFSTFAESTLPSRLHEALIEKTMQGHLVGHVSRDSTAIKGREKPTPKPPPKPKRGRGPTAQGRAISRLTKVDVTDLEVLDGLKQFLEGAPEAVETG